MRFSKVFSAALFILIASAANAANLYVATTGNDSNPGTQTAPFLTIDKAGWMAKPGDVVNVRGGVYNTTVYIASKGTATARITFQSYPGEKAIIDGTNTPANKVLVSLGQTEYVDFKGFEVRNAPYIGISAWGTKYTRVLDNHVHHAVRNGIYAGYSAYGTSSDVTIQGNTVHNTVLENQYHTWQGGWAAAVAVHLTGRATVANNKIYNNDGEGVIAVLANNVTVRKNEIFDNYSMGVYMDNARFTTVDSNLIYSTGNTRYLRDGFPGMGIAVANEIYSTSNPSTDNTIINNIVVGTRWGFFYGNFENGGGLKNTVVAHNTFYKPAQAAIEIWQDAHSNNTIENNISVSKGAPLVTLQGGGVTFRSNLWYGATPPSIASGAGDLYADPLFLNGGGFRADDYKLRPLSPAIHTAVSTRVETDHFGNARTVSADRGAHEQSIQLGSSAPVSPLPTTPSGLAAKASENSIRLTWTAVAGDTVRGYNVYRDGAFVDTVQTTEFVDTAVVASRTYAYHVTTVDTIGNESAPTFAVNATIVPAPAKDTVAPAAPAQPRVTAVTATSVTLQWARSTDNVGVIAYRIYRDGAFVTTVNTPAFTDHGLVSGQTYSYTIEAVDAAGNQSGQSAAATVKTKSGRSRAVRH